MADANGEKRVGDARLISKAMDVVADECEKVVDAGDEFRQRTLVPSRTQYDEVYKRSVEDPDSFWSDIASTFFWKKKFPAKDGKVHSENIDVSKGRVAVEWFKGGETNICYNALDRHVEAGLGDKIAFYWEGNDVNVDAKFTYKEVLDRVCQLANYLRSQGVKKGDAVAIYIPMLAELPIAMLACARIGAVHSVVVAGFSAESLYQRILDCKPNVILTCSAVKRGATVINLKGIVDDALARAVDSGHTVEVCLIYDNDLAIKREDTAWKEGRDIWWQDVVPLHGKECEAEWVDAEDTLFLLYTSESTGKPKGVLHTTGGYMVYAATTFKYAFNYHDDDVYWCTVDCGSIIGHSYVAYGALLNGASTVVFEGVPYYPDAGRCWEIVDKYNVTIFYTVPTTIRSLMRSGDEPVKRHSRKSLRVLGSVGEPISPSAWKWYHVVVGDERCPIADTWWQTETGGFMITPLPGTWGLKPGSATLPFFGVQPAVVDESAQEMHGECSGYLCIKAAWPGMMRTLQGDHDRYETTYFVPFKGFYFSGDRCRRDKDGYYWSIGRVDDVNIVSGHRIGTAEVEWAPVSHPLCAEAAVVVDHENDRTENETMVLDDREGPEEEDWEEEYVVLDLDDVFRGAPISNFAYTLSGLDTLNPILTLDNGLKLIGQYTETIGSVVVYSEKATDELKSQADTRDIPTQAEPYAGTAVKKPLKRIRGVCMSERKLKFCAMPIEDAPANNEMFTQSAFAQNASSAGDASLHKSVATEDASLENARQTENVLLDNARLTEDTSVNTAVGAGSASVENATKEDGLLENTIGA